MFVYNLEYGVNFCGENFAGDFYRWNFFLRIVKKPAKIRTGKNLVPHGRRRQALTTLCKIEQGWEGRVFQRLLSFIKAFLVGYTHVTPYASSAISRPLPSQARMSRIVQRLEIKMVAPPQNYAR